MSIQVSMTVNPCKGTPSMEQELKNQIENCDWGEVMLSRLSQQFKDWRIKVEQTDDVKRISFIIDFVEGQTNENDVKLGIYDFLRRTPTMKARELVIKSK